VMWRFRLRTAISDVPYFASPQFTSIAVCVVPRYMLLISETSADFLEHASCTLAPMVSGARLWCCLEQCYIHYSVPETGTGILECMS